MQQKWATVSLRYLHHLCLYFQTALRITLAFEHNNHKYFLFYFKNIYITSATSLATKTVIPLEIEGAEIARLTRLSFSPYYLRTFHILAPCTSTLPTPKYPTHYQGDAAATPLKFLLCFYMLVRGGSARLLFLVHTLKRTLPMI